MRILSLCTGYAGLDMAVEAVTGGNVVAYAEIMAEASAVLKHRYPKLENLGDITVIDWSELSDVDIIAAGFPCTNISDAGNLEGIDGPQSRVWYDVLQATTMLHPQLLFLENVDAIRTRGLSTVSSGLNSIGYTLVWMVLRASAVGAPHPRDRWFGIAVRVADGGTAITVEIPRFSNDKTPAGVFGTPRLSSNCGTGDLHNYKNLGRLETQAVIKPDHPSWVDRRPSLQLWEVITGRKAPAVTDEHPSRQYGEALSPRFVEWAMGLDEGHVTSAEIGLSRAQQIKVLGGGVVPQQGIAAYTRLMEEVEILMPMSEAAKAAFAWPEDLAHAPQSPTNTLGGQFKAACRCGYEGKSCSTPSHAYNATKVHADTENRRDRGLLVGPAPAFTNQQRAAAAPRAPRASSGVATPCGCGCGELSGGLFRPGHDSKLLSRLMNEIRSGSKTLADAHAEMGVIGTSDKLKDKLTQKVGG